MYESIESIDSLFLILDSLFVIEVEVESKEIKCCLYIEIIIKGKKEKG